MSFNSPFKNIFTLHRLKNIFLVFLMMTLAACGLLYEYIFSHYASRVLGSIETVVYSIIGIMVVSMGVGTLFALKFKRVHTTLSILESVIAILAISGVFIISGLNGFVYYLPEIISETYNLSYEIGMKDSAFSLLQAISRYAIYFMAFVMGCLVGMEIPLVARIRGELNNSEDINDDTGFMYGVDYIGAGIGAFIWVNFLLQMEVSKSMFYIATTNIVIGFLFLIIFKDKIKYFKSLMSLQIITFTMMILLVGQIDDWQEYLEDSLYHNEKIYSANTSKQRIALTEEIDPYTNKKKYNFFINGRTQFVENDEYIYHGLLVYPAMNIAKKTDEILLIGGGDGIALKDILKHNPKKVTMIDLDKEIIDFFTMPYYQDGIQINKRLLELNENSFLDPRLELKIGDAYLMAYDLFLKERKFDAVIIDLPDPSHPDLNKMYSRGFYKLIYNLLNDDGALVTQSASPYNSKNAFLSIKKAMENAYFEKADQYHAHIPSFGEWGWTIALKNNKSPVDEIAKIEQFKIPHDWLEPDLLKSTFHFGKKYYDNYDEIKINTEGNGVTYTYYKQAYEDFNGYTQHN